MSRKETLTRRAMARAATTTTTTTEVDRTDDPRCACIGYSVMWGITVAMEVPASFFFEGLARALGDAA